MIIRTNDHVQQSETNVSSPTDPLGDVRQGDNVGNAGQLRIIDLERLESYSRAHLERFLFELQVILDATENRTHGSDGTELHGESNALNISSAVGLAATGDTTGNAPVLHVLATRRILWRRITCCWTRPNAESADHVK